MIGGWSSYKQGRWTWRTAVVFGFVCFTLGAAFPALFLLLPSDGISTSPVVVTAAWTTGAFIAAPGVMSLVIAVLMWRDARRA